MSELILRVEYLTGRAIATAYHDREGAEWPPHPARVYSALVAHWAAHEEASREEREALEWLSRLAPPRIYASAASRRSVTPHYVPVNDTAVLKDYRKEEARVDVAQALAIEAEAELRAAEERGDTKAQQKLKKSLDRAQKKFAKDVDKLEKEKLGDQAELAAGKAGKKALQAATGLLPEGRSKQPRFFPSVTPHESHVFFYWDAETSELEEHRAALGELVSRITRIGHSSSLVSCVLADEGPAPNWEPDESGLEVMRVPEADQLSLLEDAFALHQEVEPRVLPCRFQGYRPVSETGPSEIRSGVFSESWLVFRRVGDRFSATAGAKIARAMRGALMRYAEDPPHELLSGHLADGTPSKSPHLAFVPLPFIGHRHASGDLMGVALIPPRDAGPDAMRSVYDAVATWEEAARVEQSDDGVDCPTLRITLGRAGVFEVERVAWGNAPSKTLRAPYWSAPSKEWSTVTPIALDRNPGDLFSRDPARSSEAFQNAEESIARACEYIGLPRPERVEIHPSVPVIGAIKAKHYPAFPEHDRKLRRVKVHARIEFGEPVRGPLLLGAGRYVGLGLCVPLREFQGGER